GDEIVVTNGLYGAGGRVVSGAISNRVAVTQALTVRSVNGAGVTVIRGDRLPGASNGVRCVYLARGAQLIGFTLTNGATRASGTLCCDQSGGGVWCESASAVVSNCTLIGNASHWSGGGAYSGTLHNCSLTNNSASHSGGGGSESSLHN